MTPTEDTIHAVALHLAKGIGPVIYKQLINRFGCAQAVFQAEQKELCALLQGKIPTKNLIAEKKKLLHAAREVCARHAQKNVQLLSYEDNDYPARLKQIYAPPSILYRTGSANLNASRIVSIIGTRHPTRYGLETTKELVSQLAKEEVLIVSGLAYGIDITAHMAALTHHIPTVAVIPGGSDHIYPAEHANTAARLSQQAGGLLSEYPLGVKPSIHHFSARNRIIAGIADATIVIEAPKKSGALITAYYANKYNREVFAIPNTLHTPSSVGCHTLIKRNQAHLMTHVEDLCYMMNWSSKASSTPDSHAQDLLECLSEQERYITQKMLTLPKKIITREELIACLDIPPEKLTTPLLQLEMKGVLQLIGTNYQLTRNAFPLAKPS